MKRSLDKPARQQRFGSLGVPLENSWAAHFREDFAEFLFWSVVSVGPVWVPYERLAEGVGGRQGQHCAKNSPQNGGPLHAREEVSCTNPLFRQPLFSPSDGFCSFFCSFPANFRASDIIFVVLSQQTDRTLQRRTFRASFMILRSAKIKFCIARIWGRWHVQ